MSSLTFKLIRDYWDCGNLYRNKEVTINDGLTVLVGCNGSGKSTLMTQIKDECTHIGIPCVRFDNVHDGGSHNYYGLINNWFGDNGLENLACLMGSSEGEMIGQNMSLYSKNIHKAASECKKNGMNSIVIMYDAVDSGASIDTILDLKAFFKAVIEHQSTVNGLDVYLIVVANSFEMANEENCLDIYSGEYKTFSDYDDYKKFILATRRRKERRYLNAEKREERRKAREEEKAKNEHEKEGRPSQRDRWPLHRRGV